MYNIQTAYKSYHPALHRGIVEDNIDPEGLGRCKVRVPSVHGELTYPIDILPWARPLVLSPVREGRGSVNLPDVGDIVWVLFEGANRDFPIYFGGTYGKGDLDVQNHIVDFYVENEDKISYDREARRYTVTIGNVRIEAIPGTLSLTVDGTEVIMKPDSINMTTPGSIDISAGGTINIRGSKINLN